MYCGYLRKSRKDVELEQQGQGDTLARHEKQLLELADKMNIHIDKFYREIVSGDSIEGRPEMQELLNDVGNGIWKGVFVVEVERLARGDTSDQGLVARTFKYSNTKIITPMKIYDPNNEYDENFFEFGLFMARMEYKTTTRRLQSGRKESVVEGKYTGSVAPYGYEKYKLKGEKGHSLRIIEHEAEVVRMIYKLYTYGEQQADGTYKRLGSTLLCKKLNEMNIFRTNTNSGNWTVPGLLRLLRNPVYKGYLWRKYRPEQKSIDNGKIKISRPINKNYEIYKGRHPAIIDEKTWDDTQYALDNNKVVKVPNAFLVTNNPLAGLVFCKMCGRSMTRRPYNSGGEDSLICPTSGCKNVSAKLKDVEFELLEHLKAWLDDYKIEFKKVESKGLNIESQIKIKADFMLSLNEEGVKINKQIDNLHNLLEQGVYDINTFRQRKQILNNKLEDLQQELFKINNELKILNNNKKSVNDFIPRLKNVLETYNNFDSAITKNELLKSVLEKVEYLKTERGTKKVKTSFYLDVFPRLPK